MKRKQTNQYGFSAVEGLLFLVLVLMIAGTGYYVYHAQQQSNKTLTAANNEKFANPSKKSSTKTTTPTPTPSTLAQQYLVIKEWGLKVKTGSADPNNLTYSLTGATNTEGGDALIDGAKLALKSSVTSDAACQDLGLELQKSSQKLSDRTNQHQVGNYWYDIGGSPGDCGNAQLDSLRHQYTLNAANWQFSLTN